MTATNKQSPDIKVKCLACDCIQDAADTCRRCKKKLPRPAVREVVKEVKTIITVYVSTYSPTSPVLPMSDYERMAIIHALKRCGNAVEAARALRIGKTTLYRKFIDYKIDRRLYISRGCTSSADISKDVK